MTELCGTGSREPYLARGETNGQECLERLVCVCVAKLSVRVVLLISGKINEALLSKLIVFS